jgi:PAS domain S-box-containing protein
MNSELDHARFQQKLRRALLPPLIGMALLGAVLVVAILKQFHAATQVAQADRVIAQAMDFQRQFIGISHKISGDALSDEAAATALDQDLQAAQTHLAQLIALVSDDPQQLDRARGIELKYQRWHEATTRLHAAIAADRRGSRDKWRDHRDTIVDLHAAVQALLDREAQLRDYRVARARHSVLTALALAAALTTLLAIVLIWSTRKQFLSLADYYDDALQVADQQNTALRVSEARFRNLFEATLVGTVVADQHGIIYDANDAFLQLVDRDRETIRAGQLRWSDLLPPESTTLRKRIRHEFATAGVVKPFETQALRRDGTRVPVLCGAKRFDDGSQHGVGIVVDLTDLKSVEHERIELATRERHRLRQIRRIASASLAISSDLEIDSMLKVITESAATVIGAHQAVTTAVVDDGAHGTISARFCSPKCAALNDDDLLPSTGNVSQLVREQNEPVRLSEAALLAHPAWSDDGVDRRCGSSVRGWLAVPLIARDGHNLGLIQITDKFEGDFTEEDQAILTQLAQMASVAIENARLYRCMRERDLEREQLLDRERRARAEAEHASRMKDDFLSNLSHELRTPLNAIVGWSELLADGNLPPTEASQALEIIQRNATVQMELTNELLDMSRIVSGKMQLEMQLLDLALLVEQVVESFRPSAEQKDIHLDRFVETPLPMLVADASRMQQIVWNLLTNAIKFTQPGGHVLVLLRAADECLELEVTDTGMGIDHEFLPFVFDRFRQADSSSRREFGGLGLGLAIVKQLVEMHGGTITAASAGPGMGATFLVRFPVATARAAGAPPLDMPAPQAAFPSPDYCL